MGLDIHNLVRNADVVVLDANAISVNYLGRQERNRMDVELGYAATTAQRELLEYAIEQAVFKHQCVESLRQKLRVPSLVREEIGSTLFMLHKFQDKYQGRGFSLFRQLLAKQIETCELVRKVPAPNPSGFVPLVQRLNATVLGSEKEHLSVADEQFLATLYEQACRSVACGITKDSHIHDLARGADQHYPGTHTFRITHGFEYPTQLLRIGVHPASVQRAV